MVDDSFDTVCAHTNQVWNYSVSLRVSNENVDLYFRERLGVPTPQRLSYGYRY